MSELPYPSGRQGGVLSAAEIKRLIDEVDEVREPYRLIEQWSPDYLRDASYDVRIAPDGLVLPDGSNIPITEDAEVRLNGPLILHPGDSAWLSTLEQFCLPSCIAGTVTLKSELASQGLLLLSGTLIAPRYGQGQTVHAPTDSRFDRRLHFFVANLGAQTIVLQPAVTSVASVQFLTVVGDLWESTQSIATDHQPRSGPSQPPATLGFLQSLRDIEKKYDVLDATTSRNRDLMRNLIVVGYFVLGTAVISACLATILTITSNENLIRAIRRAAPHSNGSRMLLGVIVFSVAWIIFSGAVVAGPRSATASAAPLDFRRQRDVAIRNLRAELRARVWSSIVVATVAIAALGFGIDALGGGVLWLVEIGATAMAVRAGIWAAYEAQTPFTESEIEQEMNRLVSQHEGTWTERSRTRRVLRRLVGRGR